VRCEISIRPVDRCGVKTGSVQNEQNISDLPPKADSGLPVKSTRLSAARGGGDASCHLLRLLWKWT
jgi:hypothetical protein